MNVAELSGYVEDWNVEGAADWLKHGFEAWGQPRIEPPPFYPFHARFNDHFTPEQQVAEMVSASRMFRTKTIEAVRWLFGELPADFNGFRVFNALQRLIVELHEPELLEVMWVKLTRADFAGKADREIRKELFAQAFLSAEGLSSAERTYGHLTKRMLRSRFFELGWAPSALSAMLSHDPARISGHLDVLSPIVDGIADPELRTEVIQGCRVVVSEILENAELSAIFRGMADDRFLKIADATEERPITGSVAWTLLDAVTAVQTAEPEDEPPPVPAEPDVIKVTVQAPGTTRRVTREVVVADDFEACWGMSRLIDKQQVRAGRGFEQESAYV